MLQSDTALNPTSVTISGSTATLSFSALAEDTWRLTVKDTISDATGNALDGDGDGLPGGNWRRDFVVGSLNTGLTSSNGLIFDPEFGGIGAGQIVQGSLAAFDGLNRLVIGGSDFAPAPTVANSENITSLSAGTVTSVPSGNNFVDVAGLATTINATSAGSATLSADLLYFIPASSPFSLARFVVDGVPLASKYLYSSWSNNVAWMRFPLQDVIPSLSAGSHQIKVQVASATTGASVYSDSDLLVRVQQPVNGVFSESLTSSSAGTVTSVPSGNNFVDVAGLATTINATSAGSATLSADLLYFIPASSPFSLARFVVDGVPLASKYLYSSWNNNVAWMRFPLQDVIPSLSAGSHQIKVQVASATTGASVYSDSDLLVRVQQPVNGVFSENITSLSAGTVTSVPSGNNFVDVAGLATTINATSAGSATLSADLLYFIPASSPFSLARFVVDGVPLASKYLYSSWSNNVAWMRFPLQDVIPSLSAGSHQIKVQVASATTGASVYSDSDLLVRVRKPIPTYAVDDAGRTVSTTSSVINNLTSQREVTVPIVGSQDFARTVDIFTNPTNSSINVPVRVFGNLGSDAATTVFATSDGDNIVEPTDWWFGTDDGNGTGTPAVIHLIHGGHGLIPTSVAVTEDNVDWTYNLTVAPGETKRLATFTILGNTRADAIAAVNALINPNGFGGEAASFLTQAELGSLANFQFNQAPTNVSLSPASIGENQPIGTVVGTLSTTDPDAGDSHSYTFVTGSGGEGNGNFTIEGNTIKTAAAFNFEATPSFSILVQSTDQNGLSVVKSLTIQISNVNEAPTNISLTGTSLAENAGLNFAIGTLSSIDPDAGDLLTFSLPTGVGDNNLFNISGNSLRANNSFDFEAGSSYSIAVRATDLGGLTFDRSFTITVTNANEAPTNISLTGTSLPENAGLNFAIGTLSGTDPDAGDLLTFSLPTGVGNNSLFSISGTSLSANNSFDFEAGSSYSITVRATDIDGLAFDNSFTITVTNVNETPTNISLTGASLPENAGLNLASERYPEQIRMSAICSTSAFPLVLETTASSTLAAHH